MGSKAKEFIPLRINIPYDKAKQIRAELLEEETSRSTIEIAKWCDEHAFDEIPEGVRWVQFPLPAGPRNKKALALCFEAVIYHCSPSWVAKGRARRFKTDAKPSTIRKARKHFEHVIVLYQERPALGPDWLKYLKAIVRSLKRCENPRPRRRRRSKRYTDPFLFNEDKRRGFF